MAPKIVAQLVTLPQSELLGKKMVLAITKAMRRCMVKSVKQKKPQDKKLRPMRSVDEAGPALHDGMLKERGECLPKTPAEPKKKRSKKGGSRCSGHCCRSFSIASAPEKLEELKRTGTAEEKQIANMVIYLGRFHTNPLLRLNGENWVDKALQIARNEKKPTPRMKLDSSPYHIVETGVPWYSCRHVLLNGDCGIYETRPEMCRRYPNGSPCVFTDCTWDQKDQAKHNKKLLSPHHLVRKHRQGPDTLADLLSVGSG